jgi:hypothetical protein
MTSWPEVTVDQTMGRQERLRQTTANNAINAIFQSIAQPRSIPARIASLIAVSEAAFRGSILQLTALSR